MSGITYIKRINGSSNNLVYLETSDTTATATAAGYITAQTNNITSINEGVWSWNSNDCIMLSASDGISWCNINASFTTLSAFAGTGNPEVTYSGSLTIGHFPKWSTTTGNLIDSGLAPSSTSAQLYAVTSPGSITTGHLLKAADANGTIADQGVAFKSVAGAAAAGGSADQSFSDAFCTSGSCVVGNWNTQANPASVLKIIPGNGSFVVTSSADAGVGTFNYIITK